MIYNGRRPNEIRGRQTLLLVDDLLAGLIPDDVRGEAFLSFDEPDPCEPATVVMVLYLDGELAPGLLEQLCTASCYIDDADVTIAARACHRLRFTIPTPTATTTEAREMWLSLLGDELAPWTAAAVTDAICGAL